ncbi:uncharacterized protein LOC125063198 isoform X1 [Pieris napi]|uniref:uncharacterized protein LOC125063198 isoform X1 n=2 Tax=Pieris napi TaxID=78633 RepID=UPI001FBAE22E|nr:uncharacterized protein LOC125063198 isoform X1 [Pieris napi]
MNGDSAKHYEKKLKTAEFKCLKLIRKIENLKLKNTFVAKLELPHKVQIPSEFSRYFKYIIGASVVAFLGFIMSWIFNQFYTENDCILQLPSSSKSLFRPPEDCSMCINIKNVTRLSDITADEFEELFAYTTKPVIVTDATRDWRAIKEFSYDFFADFYLNEKKGKRINDCFYFSYKSGLNSLEEVFTMDEKRANLSGEPWYVGWSTCYDEETRKLRSYYSRPYFLPKTAESDMVDWIFMGGPGQGAHMHVDSVRHISWQAQIRGRKQWELAPPPECIYWCDWITFTVEPGEILVVDTNRWYHKTTVLPGDISITIGAEFD